MRRRIRFAVVVVILSAGLSFILKDSGAVFAAESPASMANSDPTYRALRGIGLSGESIAVNNLVLQRDAGAFIFKSGNFYPLSPVSGRVTGAVFVGEGNFQLSPPLAMERQSLSILTKNVEGVINEEFDRLVLEFTDATYDEIKKRGTPSLGAPDGHAGDLFKDSQSTLRHKLHYNLPARILQDLLRNQPGGLFLAFIKGKKYNGKLLFAIDPYGIPSLVGPSLEPEEVALMTYDESKYGVWASFHFGGEYKTGQATGKQKNGVIDIVKQQLDTTIERGGKLHGIATTKFVVQAEGARVIPFDLFPALRVESVTDASGQTLPFIQEEKNDDPQFAVILPKGVAGGETFILKTAYEGKDAVMDEGGGNYYPVARDNWYPNSRFGDYAEYELTFRIPKGLTMVATGTPVSSQDEGNQNVSVWRSEVPLAVAGFNFGRFKKEEARVEKLDYTVESYSNQELPGWVRNIQLSVEQAEQAGIRTGTTLGSISTTSLMKKALAEGQLSIELYNTYFGSIPYKRIAMTQQTAAGFGQSWPALVYLPITAFFDTTVRHQIGLDDTKGFFKVVGPHEVAHQWWGHNVGFASYRDQWMSEGFAVFSSSLYVQLIEKKIQEFKKFWDDELKKMTEKNRFGRRPIDVGPVTLGYRLSNSQSGFDIAPRLIYPKGAYILHMIRMLLWDPRTADKKFIALMQDFVKTYSGQPATTEDFKAMVEKHMTEEMNMAGNGKMDWFFDEYVYGSLLPHYSLEYSFKNDAKGTVILHLKVTQSEVNDSFMMRVPIYLELADSRVIRLGSMALVGNSAPDQDVPLTGLKEKPKRVVLNFFNDVLCTQ